MASSLTLMAFAAALLPTIHASAPHWDGLNSTLGGRLHKSVPLEQPCFKWYNGVASSIDTAECKAIRTNYTLNDLRINTPEAYMSLQSQACLSSPSDQCILDASTTPAAMPDNNSTCSQGGVPSYYIEVETADDVAAAFSFAKKSDVELSVKNSGHDFMIRSSGKGSLNLWTRNLQGMKYHDNFVPDGCGEADSVGAAMTVNVGVSTVDAYNFADDHDAIILGPYAPSVGLSAGWVNGAGHSVFSPVWGMGADRVVEFHIVTPDGKRRTANAKKNADLFWALRGGGGGTFGVILSATHRVEPKVPIAYADIHLPSNATTENALDWVELLLEESLAWGEAGWGGHVGGSFVTHFNPLPALTSDDGSAAKAAFKRASDFALKLGGTSNILIGSGFAELYNKYNVPADHNMGGSFSFVSSRLMPRSKFETKEGRQSVIDYMRAITPMGFDPRSMYTPVTTPYVYKNETSKTKRVSQKEHGTSMTPAWYDALWHFETSGGIAVDSTYEERLDFFKNLTTATNMAEKLMGPGSGSYQNEANPFTLNWQDAYWGDNYEELLKIKHKYDPHRLLKCWKCVGFEEDKDTDMERFSCNAKLQTDLAEALGSK